MKNRIELAGHFAKLGYKKGVEVGVCDGVYSEKLMENIPGLKLYGIDPYTEYPGYPQERIDRKLEDAKNRLSKYEDYVLVIARSVEAAKLVEDGSLDFVFIDGKHDYEDVKEDIETWHPKVREGGIVSMHDYYKRCAGGGVVRAIDEWVEKMGIDLQTTEWDEEAYVDDRQPDAWYYKTD